MTTDSIERLREDPAALRAMALGFLFDWMGSEDFKNPAPFRDLSRCPELARFRPADHRDKETMQLRNMILDWLSDASLLQYRDNGRPGRPRQKEYSGRERSRAFEAIGRGYYESQFKESTVRRYRLVLGERRGIPETKVYVVSEEVFQLFEECFGLPSECNATEFAEANNLPSAMVKAWVKELMKGGRLVEKKVRGKRLLRLLDGKQ
jgi:hypothetical protein